MINNLNILHKQNHATLPQGWISTNLGKIVTFEYGKGLRKDKRDSTGKIPVYGSNGLIGYHCKSLTKKPCIIVGRKGAAGAVHISSCPCWPIDTTYYVEPPEGLSLNFLYYLLSILQLPSLDKSTAIPGLNRDDAYARQVHIPPIEEQKRIVSKLEELFTKLDAGIEYLKKTQTLLKQYRQSVLKYAFEGKLTEIWRNKKDNEFHFVQDHLHKRRKELKDIKLIKNETLPKLPLLWKWVKLGDIYDVTMGQSPPGNCYNTKADGMPLLNGPTEFGEKYPIPIQWTNKITKISDKNDLLICVRGHTTGRMNWSNQKYCIGRGLASIRPKISNTDNKILFYFLQMKAKELMSNTSGSTFPNLTRNKLINFHFPLIPYEEQIYLVNDIERRFSILGETEGVIKRHLIYSIKLRNSILHDAFEGKLVPQDPSDEPASVLMEKIKQERELVIPVKEKTKINKSKSIHDTGKQMRLI